MGTETPPRLYPQRRDCLFAMMGDTADWHFPPYQPNSQSAEIVQWHCWLSRHSVCGVCVVTVQWFHWCRETVWPQCVWLDIWMFVCPVCVCIPRTCDCKNKRSISDFEWELCRIEARPQHLKLLRQSSAVRYCHLVTLKRPSAHTKTSQKMINCFKYGVPFNGKLSLRCTFS